MTKNKKPELLEYAFKTVVMANVESLPMFYDMNEDEKRVYEQIKEKIKLLAALRGVAL